MSTFDVYTFDVYNEDGKLLGSASGAGYASGLADILGVKVTDLAGCLNRIVRGANIRTYDYARQKYTVLLRRTPYAAPSLPRLYHVAVVRVHPKTGEQVDPNETLLTVYPMVHAECMTFVSKWSPYRGRDFHTAWRLREVPL